MKLRRCKKAQVYNLDEELLCEAKVIGPVEDFATLEFDEPCDDVLRSEVLVTFMDSVKGLVTCFCRLRDYKEFLVQPRKQVSSVECVIVAEYAVIQRRQDIKVSVNIETSAVFRDEKQQAESADITILDISAGGLFCVSEQEWSPGQTFIISPFKAPLSFEVEVLRTQAPHAYNERFPKDGPLFGYGCKFINLAAAKETYLRKFVYDQDLNHNSKTP